MPRHHVQTEVVYVTPGQYDEMMDLAAARAKRKKCSVSCYLKKLSDKKRMCSKGKKKDHIKVRVQPSIRRRVIPHRSTSHVGGVRCYAVPQEPDDDDGHSQNESQKKRKRSSVGPGPQKGFRPPSSVNRPKFLHVTSTGETVSGTGPGQYAFI